VKAAFSGVAVAVGGAAVGATVGGGAVGVGGAKVAVGMGIGVAVGGTAVGLTGVLVNVGRSVLVGIGVAAGPRLGPIPPQPASAISDSAAMSSTQIRKFMNTSSYAGLVGW
jgi:hypothetical protein